VSQYNAINKKDIAWQIIFSSQTFLIFIGLAATVTGVLMSSYIISFLSLPKGTEETFRKALIIVFFSYPFILPATMFKGALQGLQQFSYLKVIEFMKVLLYYFFSIMLVLRGFGFLAVVCTFIILSFTEVLFAGYFTIKFFRNYINLNFSFKKLFESLNLAKYLFSASVSSLIGNNFPKLFITFTLSPQYMTMYEVLNKVSLFVKSIIPLSGEVIMPASSELFAINEKIKNKRLFFYGLKLNCIIIYPFVFCLAFFAKDFLLIWMGEDFVNLDHILQIFLLVYFIFPLGNFGWGILLGMNRKVKYISYFQWIVTFIKVLIIYFFLPIIHLWSIALANWSILFVLPFSLYFFSKEFQIKVSEIIRQTLLIGLVASLPILLVIPSKRLIMVDTYIELLIYILVWLILSWTVTYFIILNKHEKYEVTTKLFNMIKFFKHKMQ
jgi:O-antigen/teichoic acid export membrane protein